MLSYRDETSGIYKSEIGLGNDKRNVYIMDYQEVENHTHPYYSYIIPNGIPVWVKMRVSDRGKRYIYYIPVGHLDSPQKL